MEIHENIYAVLPDNDPGDGMSFIIAKMNETTATKHAAVSQNGKKKKKQKQQQQQQELQADDFPSRPPPPRPSQHVSSAEPQWKSAQKKPMRRSGHGRGRYEENGYSGGRGRQDIYYAES